MSEPREATPPHANRPRVAVANVIAGVMLAASVVVLIGRIFIGLGFTDEMQYYGEISGLTRTGRFFMVDLFLQQLGYLYVLPFFKLHALLFPEQDFLVLFGRGLLVLGYAAIALYFWTGTKRFGGFTAHHRLVALAALLAWVPFQIFALSYNSMAYLFLVALLVVRLRRTQLTFRAYAWTTAMLIAALAIIYPPAGAVSGAYIAIDLTRRESFLRALGFAGLVAGGVTVSVAAMMALHGATFPSDLLLAYRFSNAFGTAAEIRQPEQLLSVGLIGLVTLLTLVRLSRPATLALKPTSSSSSWLPTLLALAGMLVWWFGVRLKGGFSWTTGYVLLLALLALSNHPGTSRALLIGGGALSMLSVYWTPSGYFAATLYVLLIVFLAHRHAGSKDGTLRELILVGTALGLVFSVTSGNGLHNFGLGAAVVLPFLLLYVARDTLPSEPHLTAWRPCAIASATTLLLLANTLLFPWRKLGEPLRLAWLNQVPAFAGIATTPTKARVLHLVRGLAGGDTLAGKPVLVAGPHPWIYFATRAEPATPMLFMHFTGEPKAYELLRERFFQPQAPAAIFITNPVPGPIQTKLLEWGKSGDSIRAIQIPDALRSLYERQVTAELAPEIALLQRPPPAQ